MRWLRVASLFVFLLALGPATAWGRSRTFGTCSQGGNTVSVPGGTGPSTTFWNQSFPSCTVTVYLPGTTTLATIYSDSAGTAKANPFTAASDGLWFFYSDNSANDVRLSAGGIPTPFTLGDVLGNTEPFWYNVKSFGAKGDGTTNDTVAINAAIAAAAATPGVVFFPPGTYSFGTLVFPARTGGGWVELRVQGTLSPTATIGLNNFYFLNGVVSNNPVDQTGNLMPCARINPGSLDPVLSLQASDVVKNICIPGITSGDGIRIPSNTGSDILENVYVSMAVTAPTTKVPLRIVDSINVWCEKCQFVTQVENQAAPGVVRSPAILIQALGNQVQSYHFTNTTLNGSGIRVDCSFLTLCGNFVFDHLFLENSNAPALITNAANNDVVNITLNHVINADVQQNVQTISAGAGTATITVTNTNSLQVGMPVYLTGGSGPATSSATSFTATTITFASATPAGVTTATFGGGSILLNLTTGAFRLAQVYLNDVDTTNNQPVIANANSGIRGLNILGYKGLGQTTPPIIVSGVGQNTQITVDQANITLVPTSSPVVINSLGPLEIAVAVANGTVNDFTFDSTAYGHGLAEFHGSGGAVTFTGFREIGGSEAHTSGRMLTIFNNTGFTVTLANQNVGSVAANRIITGTGADVAILNQAAVTLQYSTTVNRWIVLGHQ